MKGKWLCDNYSYIGGFETSLKERKFQQYTDTSCLEGTSSGSNIISEPVIFIIELFSLILTSIYEHIAQCKNYIYSKNLNAPVGSLPVFLLPLLEEKSMFKFWSLCYFLFLFCCTQNIKILTSYASGCFPEICCVENSSHCV